MESAAPYAPVLPDADPNPAIRRASIEQGQSQYQIAHAYADDDGFDGVAVAASVPAADAFSLRFIAEVAGAELRLLSSHTFSALFGSADEATADSKPTLRDYLGLARMVGNSEILMRGPRQAASRIAQSFPADLTNYKDLFGTLTMPDVVSRLDGPASVQDAAFAWQRVAGVNPLTLQGITAIPGKAVAKRETAELDAAIARNPTHEWDLLTGLLPEEFAPPPATRLPGWFKVTDAQYQSVMGEGDSLERAADERRLYLVDARDVAGLPAATWDAGVLEISRRKWIYPTLSLYAWRPATDRAPGCLEPVAIQVDQAGQNRHVWTPADGNRWKMAKFAVQCADGVVQELKYHLGRAHLIMEAAILTCRRSMAPSHPLRILLEPHFAFTLPINDFATKNLIAPGGQVEQLFASTLAGSLQVLTRGMRTLQFRDLTPDRDVAARSVDSVDGLSEYPWRDDALEVHAAIRSWVASYCALYYPSDEAVSSDPELAAFVHAFGDPAQGAIRGVDPVATREQLVTFVSTLVWAATAGHSALNYAQFPFVGYAPNLTGALYAEAPTPQTPDVALSWLEMLPPTSLALVQLNLMYELSSVQTSTLGYYPRGWFIDDRVLPLNRQFKRRLKVVDKLITGRDATRFMPYPYLRPSKTGQSVFI